MLFDMPGKPKLYFSKGDEDEKEEKKKSGHKIMKSHIQKHISKQKNIPKEPEAKINLNSGKLSVARSKEQIESMSKPKEAPKPEGKAEEGSKPEDVARPKEQAKDTGKPEEPLTREEPVAQEKQSGDRCATGIEGFDGLMEGGFIRNSSNIVVGGSGSGKSIFSVQFLVNGIEKYGEHGVYISFEQDQKRLIRDMKKFGWKLEEKIKNNQLAIVHYTPEQVGRVLETGAGTVRDIVASINAKRVVIDSISAFLLLHESELERRKELLKLFTTLEKWGCTSLLISEQEQDPEKHESAALEFSCDGIIIIYYVRRGDVRTRAIEIFKMRATQHMNKIVPMEITDSGIAVFPQESVF
jgi:KaiC/GvpD/RAD55 family RecA-like ATPase